MVVCELVGRVEDVINGGMREAGAHGLDSR